MKRFGKILTVALLLLSAALLTAFSDRAAEYAKGALTVCAQSVIPSLFPYMVISKMIVKSGGASYIGRLLPISRLFSLPECATAPILLGAVCGFPVGAQSAVSLYSNGELSKEEAEVLISCANNTGPSFVVSVIGATYFRSQLFGWYLYFFQLIASVISALIINKLVFRFKNTRKKSTKRHLPRLEDPGFFSAVTQSAESILSVCGFIVFFSVIAGFAVPFFAEISDSFAGVFCALLEFTQGAGAASVIGGAEGRFLCGLSIGWSGLSVFCQTAAFSSPAHLSLKRCVCTKALQGILTGALAALVPLGGDMSVTELPRLYSDASVVFSGNLYAAALSAILYAFAIKKLSKKI